MPAGTASARPERSRAGSRSRRPCIHHSHTSQSGDHPRVKPANDITSGNHPLGYPIHLCDSWRCWWGSEGEGSEMRRARQRNAWLYASPTWRRRMGVEPTRDSDYCPADGFEDREAHRDPSASMGCSWLVAPHDERPRAPIVAHAMSAANVVEMLRFYPQSRWSAPPATCAPTQGRLSSRANRWHELASRGRHPDYW